MQERRMDSVGLTLKKCEYLIQQHKEAHQLEDEYLKVPVCTSMKSQSLGHKK